MQDPQIKLKVVCVTNGQGFEESLEKRVASRLARVRISLPPFSAAEAMEIVQSRLPRPLEPELLEPAVAQLHRVTCYNVRLVLAFATQLYLRQGAVGDALNAVLGDVWELRVSGLCELEMCALITTVLKEQYNIAAAYEMYAKIMRRERTTVFDKKLFTHACTSLMEAGALEVPKHVLQLVVRKYNNWPSYMVHYLKWTA